MVMIPEKLLQLSKEGKLTWKDFHDHYGAQQAINTLQRWANQGHVIIRADDKDIHWDTKIVIPGEVKK
jgi:hypothetical protein